jgi:topoisomerase-4 subunit A
VYLTYALSTIMHRAVDARDGLKPMHGEFFYAMREPKLTSGGFPESLPQNGWATITPR